MEAFEKARRTAFAYGGDAIDELLATQLGVYIVLEMPEHGGTLLVYDRKLTGADAGKRVGYGLDPGAVSGNGFVGVVPQPGDLILFPDRNLHQVHECSGKGRRVKRQLHLGVSADSSVVAWS